MTQADEIDRRFRVAQAVARDAAALALDFMRDPARLEIRAKGRRDYVTAADAAVEQLIRARIAKEFPGDGVLGEEGGGAVAPFLWVVDPIDGTSNFARGLPNFCVSIAFCVDGRPEIGVIQEPVLGTLYAARRGGGAFRDGVRLQPSETREPGQSMIEFGYCERMSSAQNMALMQRLVDAGCDVRVAGSAALGLARVAEGRIDGYCELHLWSWDVLAGLLLIEEAGGRTNAFLANNGLTGGNPVLASAPGLADALQSVTGMAWR
jgi:myo-inositol-1(or 4)-monophosphatase